MIMASLNKLMNSLNENDNVIGVLKDTSVANQVKNIVIDLDKSPCCISSATV